MENHFFDSASTTPCCKLAIQLMTQYAVEDFGNPSSSHAYGRKAQQAIKDARAYFARSFRIESDQVIFTGSGTEADNLAIQGVALAALARKQSGGRILITSTEHPAVLKTAQALKALGFDVQTLHVDRQGQVTEDALLGMLTPQTLLVSIHQVNNITGALLPVAELARKCKERAPQLIFHTDAVQSFGKVPHPDSRSPIDLVSISGHKVRGPKGVGALIVLNRKLLTQLRPVIFGGDQEAGLRSGTQNAGLIAGFAAGANETLHDREQHAQHCMELRSRLLSRLEELHVTPQVNTPEHSAPHILSLSFPGYDSGPLFRLIEERGFQISTGSACHSTKQEPDPVLLAMGISPERATSALRISFSELNSLQDADDLAEVISQSIQRMSALTGRKKR